MFNNFPIQSVNKTEHSLVQNGTIIPTKIIGDEKQYRAKEICDHLLLTNVSKTVKNIKPEQKTHIRESNGANALYLHPKGALRLLTKSIKPEAQEFIDQMVEKIFELIKHGTVSLKTTNTINHVEVLDLQERQLNMYEKILSMCPTNPIIRSGIEYEITQIINYCKSLHLPEKTPLPLNTIAIKLGYTLKLKEAQELGKYIKRVGFVPDGVMDLGQYANVNTYYQTPEIEKAIIEQLELKNIKRKLLDDIKK